MFHSPFLAESAADWMDFYYNSGIMGVLLMLYSGYDN